MDRLSAFIQLVSHATIQLDERLHIENINPKALELLNVPREHVIGHSYPAICRQLNFKSVLPADMERVWSGETLKDIETHVIHPDGQIRILSWTVSSYIDEVGGSAVFLVATDITEQMLAKQRAMRVQVDLSNILQNMPGCLYWKDQFSVYQGCNENFARMLGLSAPADVIGKTDAQLNWPVTSLQAITQADQQAIRGESTLDEEESRCFPGGHESTLLIHRVPIRDVHQEVIGMMGVYSDITNRKAQEQALFAAKTGAEMENQEKSTFIANMSHDLKTPLHSVMGLAEILKIKPHAPEQDEYIDGIIQSATTILKLVEDILSYSKLESGDAPLVLEEFDLRELVESVVNSFSGQASEKRVQLVLDYCDTVPHQVRTDIEATRRILVNLLSNALKFTNQGHIMLTVEATTVNDTPGLKISLEDTGVGMSSAQLEKIYDRFYRATTSFSSGQSGAGLGLTVVKQLVESLDGQVAVVSELGKGTTFTVTLPLQLVDTENDNLWSRENAHVRTLVVDDYEIRGYALAKQLGQASTVVTSSTKMFSTLVDAAAVGQPYHVLILDDDLLEQDWFKITRTLNTQPEANALMKVALVDPKHAEEKLHASAVEFAMHLTKPVQPTQLTTELMQCWKRWAAAQQKAHAPTPLQRNVTRVLLVEDNLFSQKVAKVMLEGLGCSLDIADTGTCALEKATQFYDVIFMDIGLPDKDGIEVTEAIRTMGLGNPNVYICALTAHGDEAEKQRCFEVGMNAFLSKPARLEDFQRILAESVEALEEQDVLTV